MIHFTEKMTNQSVNLHIARKPMFYLLYYTESLNKSFYPFVDIKHICSVCEISQTLVGFFNSCKSNAAKAMPFLNIQNLLIK